jgi:putative SOS response-associated peptidase YedK
MLWLRKEWLQETVSLCPMPVILRNVDEDTWLNPDITEPEQLQPLLQPYPADKMEGWRVGDAAKNWRNASPDLIKPIGEHLQPQLH